MSESLDKWKENNVDGRQHELLQRLTFDPELISLHWFSQLFVLTLGSMDVQYRDKRCLLYKKCEGFESLELNSCSTHSTCFCPDACTVFFTKAKGSAEMSISLFFPVTYHISCMLCFSWRESTPSLLFLACQLTAELCEETWCDLGGEHLSAGLHPYLLSHMCRRMQQSAACVGFTCSPRRFGTEGAPVFFHSFWAHTIASCWVWVLAFDLLWNLLWIDNLNSTKYLTFPIWPVPFLRFLW